MRAHTQRAHLKVNKISGRPSLVPLRLLEGFLCHILDLFVPEGFKREDAASVAQTPHRPTPTSHGTSVALL